MARRLPSSRWLEIAPLALALYGLSRTVADMGLLPRWLDRVSLAGAGLLVIGSTQSAAVLEGFLPGILFGMVGFGIWLLFLIVSGLRLARS